MSAVYWKFVGENIAKNLGKNTLRRLGIGGKFIGRAGAMVGIGLRKLQLQISRTDDYRPLQQQLARIVDDLRPIENGYTARTCDCSREIKKTLGSNAAWAAVSMTTLGLVKKPKSEEEM